MSPRWASTREERFWARVDRRGDNECWLWRGGVRRGYGVVSLEPGRTAQAQRFAYELLIGPIPEGLVTDHLCRTPLCVNPAHLEPVTIAENTRRGALAQERCHRGHARPMHVRAARRHCLECKRERNSRLVVCVRCGTARAVANMRRLDTHWRCGPNLVCGRRAELDHPGYVALKADEAALDYADAELQKAKDAAA